MLGEVRYQKDFQWIKDSALGNGMSGKCSLATDFNSDAKFCVKEVWLKHTCIEICPFLTFIEFKADICLKTFWQTWKISINKRSTVICGRCLKGLNYSKFSLKSILICYQL